MIKMEQMPVSLTEFSTPVHNSKRVFAQLRLTNKNNTGCK